MMFAVICLIINSMALLCMLKVVTKSNINPLSPVVLFNVGFFYSYFFSGFLLQFDLPNFLIYPGIWKNPNEPLELYFLPAWLGIISFNIGYCLSRKHDHSRHIKWKIKSNNEFPKAQAVLPLILLALAVFSSIGIFTSTGVSIYDLIFNPEGWEQLRDQAMRNWSGENYLYLLPVYIGFFHLCVLTYLRPRRKQSFMLFFFVLIALLILGSRALLLSWIVSLLIFYDLLQKKISTFKKYIYLGAIVAFGAIFGILQKLTTDGAIAQTLPFPLNLFRRLQTSYEQFENLVNVINSNFSFDFGRSILEDVFLTYMPRAIFPWKPADVGYLRAQNLLFYNDFWSIDRGTTYPVGIIAELYFNFWYVGIIFGMLALGVILYRLEKKARSDFSYLPALCAMGGIFLSPHRYFGPLLLTLTLFIGFIFVNKKITNLPLILEKKQLL